MKKSLLILLPLAATALVGCRGGRGGSTGTEPGPTSITPTTQPTTAPTTGTNPTTAPTTVTSDPTTRIGPTTQGETGNWDVTPGQHTKTIDFINDYANLKSGFPYVAADTGITDAKLDGLSILDRGTYVSSYNNSGFLMMKNKNMDGNLAFIASQVSLGTITKVTVICTTGDSAPQNQVYNILISDSPSQDASSAGTSFTGQGTWEVTGSGKYFTISTGNVSKNGQIGSIIVEYTI